MQKMREMRSAALSGQPRPKVFYVLPKRGEALTLEKDSKALYRQESAESSSSDDKTPNVTKWIRQSSGVFKEDYLEHCHAKMLDEASKTITRPRTSRF